MNHMLEIKQIRYTLYKPLYIYVATVILYIGRIINIRYFPLSEFIGYLLGVISIIYLIIYMPQVRGLMRLVVGLMLLSGTAMFFLGGGGFLDYLLGLSGMINLLCIFMILELVGYPVSMIKLEMLFKPILGMTNSPGVVYGILSLISMFLGSIVNVAVVPLVFYSVWGSLQERKIDHSRFIAVSMKRGLSLSLFWSPFGIMMAIVLEYSGVKWVQLAPAMVFISLVSLLVSILIENFSQPTWPGFQGETSVETLSGESWKVFKLLLGYVISLAVTVLLLNRHFGMTDTLILTSLLIPWIWSKLLGKESLFKNKVKNHFEQTVPNLGAPFSLFITAGIFVKGLHAVGFEKIVELGVLTASNYVGAVGLIIFISTFIMLLSWVGLHPIVSLVIISQNLNFQSGVISPLFYAWALIVGGSLANLTSPVAAVTIVTAGLVKKSPFEVGVMWNLVFIIVFLSIFYPILQFYLYLIKI